MLKHLFTYPMDFKIYNMKKSILILFSLFSFSIAFAQSGYNLEFSQAILVESSTMTVPSGKVWKVVSVQRSNHGNGGVKININGLDVSVGGATSDGVATGSFPIWLPAGSTISTGIYVHFISVVEFNLISN